MKRKLIDYQVFKKINQDSLSSAEQELIKAEDILAKALNVDQVSLHCYGENDVTYQTPGRTFIHATYQITEGNIYFENIEELVIDESTAKEESRKVLNTMVEELLNNEIQKAEGAFNQYLSMPTVRRSLMESKMDFVKKDKKGKKAKMPFGKPKCESRHQVNKASRKLFKEWKIVSENVSTYLNYKEFGPVMKDSELKSDEKGNVIGVKIPTSNVRNEAKLLNLTYKHMLDTELKVMRGKMKVANESAAFCHAMADLRKANAVSDAAATQEVLEAIVTKWPEILYITQEELAKSIATALETIGVSHYDDEMCNFMAESILQTAVELIPERVQKIVRLSGAQLDKDSVYESFQNIVRKFYPKMDEATGLEMQVFVDLYNALVEVHKVANMEANEALRAEANNYLEELDSVIRMQAQPSLELASEIAGWLSNLVEANVAGAEETWDVSNTPHQTVAGDHPRMAWAAKQGDAVPSKHHGDWPGKLPVSDGKSYKNSMEDDMRNNAWGNIASDETWPSLRNPYSKGETATWTMKGEKGADKDGDSDWSRYQSKDTWPNLQNPLVKDSPWDVGKYKMKSDNLVTSK